MPLMERIKVSNVTLIIPSSSISKSGLELSGKAENH